MHRRNFLGGLGLVAATWPIAAHGQQPAIPVIGFLSGVSPRGPYTSAVTGFRQGLSENGFTEGVNVVIEFRWAEGRYERLADMADDLVRRNVSVIYAGGSNVGVKAAKAATTTIPIVFTTGGDPVEDGLVTSLGHPAGNVTGVTLMVYRLEMKRLELFHELVPKAGVIRAIVNRSSPIAAIAERNLRQASDAFGLPLDIVDAHTDEGVDAAFETLAEKQIGGIFVMGDPFLNSRSDRIASLAAHHKTPTSFDARELAVAGGLMSYGTSVTELYRQAGSYVGKILKGAKPADLPVLQPTKFEFVINLKTAKALGLSVPQTLLVAADEVIE